RRAPELRQRSRGDRAFSRKTAGRPLPPGHRGRVGRRTSTTVPARRPTLYTRDDDTGRQYRGRNRGKNDYGGGSHGRRSRAYPHRPTFTLTNRVALMSDTAPTSRTLAADAETRERRAA